MSPAVSDTGSVMLIPDHDMVAWEKAGGVLSTSIAPEQEEATTSPVSRVEKTLKL